MKTILAFVLVAAAATAVALSAQAPSSGRFALAAWPGARNPDGGDVAGVDPLAPLCRARPYGRCPGP